MQREVRNRMGEGSLLNNLGGVAHSLGQYDKAIDTRNRRWSSPAR